MYTAMTPHRHHVTITTTLPSSLYPASPLALVALLPQYNHHHHDNLLSTFTIIAIITIANTIIIRTVIAISTTTTTPPLHLYYTITHMTPLQPALHLHHHCHRIYPTTTFAIDTPLWTQPRLALISATPPHYHTIKHENINLFQFNTKILIKKFILKSSIFSFHYLIRSISFQFSSVI